MDSRRALDLFLSAGAACAFAPVQLAAATLILLEDGLPIVFVQERVGQHRRPFRVFKLRTMRDERVTKVGRWLRTTGLDETPQFLCVLRGDMSIVGPRPLTLRDIERLGWAGPAHDARFAVRPGITGLAQVIGGVSARHTRALDALYARRASLELDLWLIAVSFAMNLGGKTRVRRWLRRSTRPAGPPARARRPVTVTTA